jgi:hypothetical protein
MSAMRLARNTMSLAYSIFSGKPTLINHSGPGVGDGMLCYNLSAGNRASMVVVTMGLVGIVAGLALNAMGFPNWIVMPVAVMDVAGIVYSTYKSYTKAEQGIDIRPDGVTKFGCFKSKFRKIGLEGEGTILWPNGVGYEGIFENDLIKNNPNGKLILFPEKNKYNVEFPDTRIPGKENEKHTFTNVHYFKNTSYNRVNKLLRFADGDVFRGIPYGNIEGIYIPINGTAVVGVTFRDVLSGKTKKASGTEIEFGEPIYEETINCEDPDGQIQKLQKN